MLADCLESCREAVDEMIIVDTGSSDRTVEIAESFGARVLHFAVERAASPRPATSASTRRPALDPLARRRRAARAGRCGAARASSPRQPWREAHWLVETNYTGQDEAGTASHAPRAAALAQPARLPLLGRDPRADPQLDAVSTCRERFGAADAADPPLRLPQEPHRRARQAPAQPRAAARASSRRTRAPPSRTSTSAPSTSAWTTSRRRARHYEQGLDAAPRRARLVGARLRADARLAPVRRAPLDRRSRGRRGARERAARALPGLHRPRLRARAVGTGPRRPRTGAPALFERCLEMGDAPPRFSGVVGRGSFLALGALALVATNRGDRERGRAAGSSGRSSCTRSTSPTASSSPTLLLAPARRRSRRRARAARGVRARRADLVPVPRHRVLRARPRRARRGPPAPLPRDRRRAMPRRASGCSRRS